MTQNKIERRPCGICAVRTHFPPISHHSQSPVLSYRPSHCSSHHYSYLKKEKGQKRGSSLRSTQYNTCAPNDAVPHPHNPRSDRPTNHMPLQSKARTVTIESAINPKWTSPYLTATANEKE